MSDGQKKRHMSAHVSFERYSEDSIITTLEGVTASVGFSTIDELRSSY